MGRTISAPASPIKSRQSGYIPPSTVSVSGTGEDARYIDVTISPVDVAKCAVSFDGGFSTTAANAMATVGGSDAYTATARLTTSTNLRIASSISMQPTFYVAGRWTVLEFA